MISIPIGPKVPSESTIEQMSNHHILMELGAFESWFFVPDKREEKWLGYDAFLQGYKTLVIQYKKLIPSSSSWPGGSISIKTAQHKTLLKKFPKATTKIPYAFYGFALHHSYADIMSQMRVGGGRHIGMFFVYVNIHDVVVPKSKAGKEPKSFILSSKILSTIDFHNLYSLCEQFMACSVGMLLQGDPQGDRYHPDEDAGTVSVLYSKRHQNWNGHGF
ncbi:hypothetical protein ACM9XA_19040 [Xanthomonas sacchari]